MTDTPAPATSTEALTVHVNADAQQAWIMLREPAKLLQWHGWDSDSLKDEVDTIYFTNAVEDADHRSLTVDGGDTFQLHPEQGGISISVERANDDPTVTEGWVTFLQQLRFALERHPNSTRRTLYFSGASKDGRSIISTLGLDDVRAPGEDYSASLPTGIDITGKVWFRSANQLGLTVHAYAERGDGLLILGDLPGGESIAIASTYELGAKQLHDVWERWDEFRGVHYPDSEPIVTSTLE
ncbi:SRPBCC domain-containing protein [Arthrobacter roseus]|uniref:SRPBCC domain-containing protein n=1 Tax=Arthrobacter roseus TaxID=136274 RepID=UPI001962B1EC|nr:SRPBCC domain-containing protein [Arthrobacter roseus]MBM7847549.1 hypothetical protein [Arthrobacter roseus]